MFIKFFWTLKFDAVWLPYVGKPFVKLQGKHGFSNEVAWVADFVFIVVVVVVVVIVVCVFSLAI